MKKIILIMLGLALALSACASLQGGNDAGQLQRIRLPMGYIPNIQFAPFYVAVEKGYFAQEGIQLDFDYSFETDGVKLVGANELPFAVVSGEQVLLAREQEVPAVYAFAWYQGFPVSVVAAPELNIKEPKDLKGQTIGVPGLFGATYVGLEALLFSAGLGADDVKLETIGFNQVELFSTGKNKIVVGYTGNEPIVLRSQGKDITELRVGDYAHLASNGIITNEKTIAEDPQLVRGMMRALARGIKDTIANPDEAYQISLKYVENLGQQDKKVQMDILNTSIGFWKTDRIGFSDPQAWSNMNDLLVKMKLLSKPQDVSKAFTNDFVP